jgi:hypothetical protein
MKFRFVVVLIAFALLTGVQDSYCNDYSKLLLDKYPIKSNEVLACVFLDFGSCVKCVLFPAELVEKLNKDLNVNIKIIGLVNCSRKREANDYKKHNNWHYDVEPDVGRQARAHLNCDDNTNICFINSEGKVIIQLSTYSLASKEYKAIKDTIISCTKSNLLNNDKK